MREQADVCEPVATAATIMSPELTVPIASNSKVAFMVFPLTVADPDW
jgi:hypothetical protein